MDAHVSLKTGSRLACGCPFVRLKTGSWLACGWPLILSLKTGCRLACGWPFVLENRIMASVWMSVCSNSRNERNYCTTRANIASRSVGKVREPEAVGCSFRQAQIRRRQAWIKFNDLEQFWTWKIQTNIQSWFLSFCRKKTLCWRSVGRAAAVTMWKGFCYTVALVLGSAAAFDVRVEPTFESIFLHGFSQFRKLNRLN